MNKNIMWGIGLSFLFLAPAVALGAMFYTDEKAVVLGGEEVMENVYTASERVVISSAVAGDLVAAGGDVSVDGRVRGDVMLAGGDVVISSDIDGDVRAVGGNVTILGRVGGDVVVAGGEVRIGESASVGRDLVVAGGRVRVSGSIGGDVEVWSNESVIDARVGGRVSVHSKEGLYVGDGAVVVGDLSYYGSQKQVSIASGAEIAGELVFKDNPYEKRHGSSFTSAFFGIALVKFLAFFLTALLAVLYVKKLSQSVAHGALHTPGASLLTGFLALFLLPIFACLLFFTLIGGVLGALALAVFALIGLAGLVYAPVVLGVYIEKRIKKTTESHMTWKTVLMGVFTFSLLGIVPIVGWLVICLIVLVSAGAFARTLWERVCS